jgi:preprotein translocase subunit SecA
MLSKQIEKAQRKVEEQNFLMRKHTLEYDDVLNQQREVIYNYRDEILEGRDMSGAAREEVSGLIDRLVAEYTAGDFVEEWDVEGLLRRTEEILGVSEAVEAIDPRTADRDELVSVLQEEVARRYDEREQEMGDELMREVERFLLLQIIDQRWREHLYDMDYLREGIHLRGFAQIEPLVAYKNEAFELFRDLMNTIWGDFTQMIFHVEVTPVGSDGQPLPPPAPSRQVSRAASSPTGGGRVSYSGGVAAQGSMALAAAAAEAGVEGNGYSEDPIAPVEQRRVTESEQIGRNDPCWCGSGKKFKKCHGV